MPKKCPCGKQTIFGFPDDKTPNACSNCKKDGMIDITHKKCLCGKNMSFGFPDDKTPSTCFNCKKDGMIDIKSKKCSCGKQMNFGFRGDKIASACSNCKEDGMVDIKNKKCLCGTRASFGFSDDKIASACSNCKKDGMIDIRSKKCISCGIFIVKKPYLCSYCNPETNKRQKTSEMILYNFLEENKIDFIHNKSVGFVCGNYRPDFLIDCNTHFIVIENDENQHFQYPEECEITRMFNIEQSLGLRTHFIRYNPDAFKINNITKRIPRKKRMEKLLERIEMCYNISFLENILSIEYLYYNQ